MSACPVCGRIQLRGAWWSSSIHNGLCLGNPDVQEVPSSILAPCRFSKLQGWISVGIASHTTYLGVHKKHFPPWCLWGPCTLPSWCPWGVHLMFCPEGHVVAKTA